MDMPGLWPPHHRVEARALPGVPRDFHLHPDGRPSPDRATLRPALLVPCRHDGARVDPQRPWLVDGRPEMNSPNRSFLYITTAMRQNNVYE